MNKQIEFSIQIESFDKDAYRRLTAARDQVAAIERSILDAYKKSDRHAAIYDVGGKHVGMTSSKAMPVCRIAGSEIITQTFVSLPDEKTQPATYPNISEKTLNVLLSGKLLTDDEKKALIAKFGVDVAELKAKP